MHIIGESTTVGKSRKRHRRGDANDHGTQPVRRSIRLLRSEDNKKLKGEFKELVMHHPSVTVTKDENVRRNITVEGVVKANCADRSAAYNSNGSSEIHQGSYTSECSSSDLTNDSLFSTESGSLCKSNVRRDILIPSDFSGYDTEAEEEEERKEREDRALSAFCRSEIARMKKEAPEGTNFSDSIDSDSGEDTPSDFLSSAEVTTPSRSIHENVMPICDEEEHSTVSEIEYQEHEKVKHCRIKKRSSTKEIDDMKSDEEVSDSNSIFSSSESDSSCNNLIINDETVGFTLKKTFKNIPEKVDIEPTKEEKMCHKTVFPHTGFRCSQQTGVYSSTEMNLGLQLWDRW